MPGPSLVFTRGRLSFLPVSATVLHCLGCRCRWNERLGAWVQLEVHRQHHREHCYLIRSLKLRPADVGHPLMGPHLAFTSSGLVPPRLGDSRGGRLDTINKRMTKGQCSRTMWAETLLFFWQQPFRLAIIAESHSDDLEKDLARMRHE